MKKILLAFLFLLFSCYCVVQAQNKTLGVGVAIPNANAALHVESPTGNQGLIIPRLTTVQRNAMGAILKDVDKGLMLFDTDLATVYIWNGAKWNTSSQVAGGPKLVYPYADTVSTSPGVNKNLLSLVYAGSATDNVGVAHFENMNPNSGFATIFGRTNSATNGVADFVVNNPDNTNDGLSVVTNGTGTAGRFTTNNTKSKMPTLWVETNSDSALSAPIYGLNTGKGDVAASFRINNAASPFPALFAESNGTGRTATFRKLGTTGSQPAVFIDSRGGHGLWADHNSPNGYAAIIQTIDVTNGNAGMFVESIGTGPSIWAIKSTDAVSGDALRSENWIASGSAGNFNNTNATNASATLISTTAGIGSAGSFSNSNVENGNATLFTQTSGTGAALQAETASGFSALYAYHSGATNGNAALIEITGATNTFPALQANTVGTGNAINARHTGTGGDAVYAEHAGAANGSAGNFRISNNLNSASALFAATNSTTGGTAIGASHDGGAIALAIWSGGMQVTTHTVTAASIVTRAMAYHITAGGTVFTLDYGPMDGEVFMVFNETGAAITVAGIPLANQEGKTFIVFPGGTIRGF